MCLLLAGWIHREQLQAIAYLQTEVAAIDFLTTEVWTKHGLVTYFALFVIDLASRRVEIAGITVNPDAVWMKQIARNLTDADHGCLRGKKYLLMTATANIARSSDRRFAAAA